MSNHLKPVTAVHCHKHERLISVDECEGCRHCKEVRKPWFRFSVDCEYELKKLTVEENEELSGIAHLKQIEEMSK